jgi:hypothetical protein
MNFADLLLRMPLVIAVTISNFGALSSASADCYFPNHGKVIGIKVESCEVINGQTNKDVVKYAGDSQKTRTILKLYTGALVTTGGDVKWVYPSAEANPCRKFARSAQVKMRAYLTCCDTGRWGKCVFDGRWLGDVDGPPVNSDQ